MSTHENNGNKQGSGKADLKKSDIEKIGRLSRLKLTDQDVELYTNHLTMILKHFDELATVDTANIEPLVTPTQSGVHIAKDEVRREVSTEEILKNAPEKSGNLFKVPPVVGGD